MAAGPPPEDSAGPLPTLPDLSIAQLLSIRHDEAFSNARRRKKGPKSAVSAFSYFNAANLEKIVADCDEAMAPSQIVSIVADRWENLTGEERAVYLDQAEKDQIRYREQCRPSAAKAEELAAKKAKKRKHPGAPKHPKSAYLFFVGENRDTIKRESTAEERNSFTAIAKILGERWKILPDIDRNRYEKLAEDDKMRYRAEKLSFIQRSTVAGVDDGDKHTEDDDEDVTENGVVIGKRKRKHPMAPKHPLSAYLFFVATHRAALTAQFPLKTFTEIAKIIGDIWQIMSVAKRKKYAILAAADKKRYELEMREWSTCASNPLNDNTIVGDERAQPDPFPFTAPDRKRERDREAAQTMTTMLSSRQTLPAKRAEVVVPTVVVAPFQPDPSSLFNNAAFRAFVQSESEYILSVDPDIDQGELDAALRLTWMDMSAHEKLAFVVGSEQPDESAVADPALPVVATLWTSEHIASFVADRLGFGQYRDAFLNSTLTGEGLAVVTTNLLKKEFGVTNMAHRKEIKTAFDKILGR